MVPRPFVSWLYKGSLCFLKACLLLGAVWYIAGNGSSAQAASGGINSQINYQGKLLDTSGAAVSDGTYNMVFSLYNTASNMVFSLYNTASVGPAPFWTASGTLPATTTIPVSVNDGLFTVMLGDTSASGGWQNSLTGINWNNDEIYLGISIEGDGEMTPRKRIGAVPQAFNAMQLQGMYASGTALSGQTLFSVNQVDTSSPGADRSAFDVRTAGSSPTKDFIARFYSATGAAKVSIRNDGYTSVARLAGQTSSSEPIVSGLNSGEKSMGRAWGGAFSTLSVGTVSPGSTTGTLDMVAVMKYAGSHENALCLDNTETGDTCGYLAGSSLIAEGTINASAFDLAEQYSVTGEVEPSDVLEMDPEHPMFVRRSSGTAESRRLVGIASTQPGLLLGNIRDGVQVALAGRVPTKVSTLNGPIAIGDPLTASPFAGVAMKATRAGQIVGFALQSATATGTIEVFVKVGYDGGPAVSEQGETTLAQGDLILAATSTATADVRAVDSWGITWRGSLWDGIQDIRKDFTLANHSTVDGLSALNIRMGTSTLWSLDEAGSMRVARDLVIGGRFFPATRAGAQSDKYVFLDDTGPASSTYVATNADGWQANTSYDFAERYYSPDALEPGDVVVLSQRGRFHVQRTMKSGDVPVGIVSTRPAFVAGAPEPSTFPIALAGRVPTRVSAGAGVINVGDPLVASSMPGVVVKAIQAGPIVGYALESYTSASVGKIEVFVNAGWWGGSAIVMNESKPEKVGLVAVATTSVAVLPKSYQGVARILAGATKVKVIHPSLGTFPLIQVTPYGKVDTQWWTDNSSDRGFEIALKEPLTQDVTFSWRVEEMLPTDNQLFLSNEQPAQWDIYNGQPILPAGQTQTNTQTLPDVTSATTTTETATTTIETIPETTTTTTEETAPTVPETTPPITEEAPVVEEVPAPVVEPVPVTEVEPVVESTPATSPPTEPAT